MDDHDLTRRLRDLGSHPIDPSTSARDLRAMAAVRPARSLGGKVRLAGAFLAGLLIGSTGLAAADVLPDPAQHVAHTVLDRVGVKVPDPERYHGPECGAEVKKNHGAYVRDDHTLAQTDCGKKAKAAGAGETDDDEAPGAAKGPKTPKAAKGPCQGKPPWAGNKTMTAEERAAAQAERTAQCGDDEDEVDDAVEADEAPEAEDGSTTTETSVTTDTTPTTEAPTTTEVTTTTTVG